MRISIDEELQDPQALQDDIQYCIDGLQEVIRKTQPYLHHCVSKEQDKLAVDLINARLQLNNFINGAIKSVSEVLVVVKEVAKIQ